MKKIIVTSLLMIFTIISGCQTVEIKEDKEVSAEIYLVHSKLKSYETFSDNSRRDWPSYYTIEEVLNEFPNGSKPEIIHHTKIESNWGKFASIEEYNFLDATKWDIKNREWINKVEEQPVRTSEFSFKMTPKHFEDGSIYAEMVLSMEFLRTIEKVEGKEVYYPINDIFKAAKAIQFIPNKFYVFEARSLENKSSLIIIYKLKNE